MFLVWSMRAARGRAVPMALQHAPMHRCACFGWCNTEQIQAFLSGLPSSVTTRDSPWYSFLRNVYHSDPALPINLTAFGTFMFAAASEDAPAVFDTDCAALGAAKSWCGAERCGAWINTSMPMLSLGRRRGSLAPWSWNISQRKLHDKAVGIGVLYSSIDRVRHIGQEQQLVKVHIHGPALLQDIRSDFRGRQVMLVRARKSPMSIKMSDHFHPDHEWVEVYRTLTNSSWYAKNNLWEGVNYGCWFYPLLPPFHRGSGIFVNLGRSMRFWSRADANLYFRDLGNWTIENGVLSSTSDLSMYVGRHNKHAVKMLDAHWATKANGLGYDSIQLLAGADGMPEVVIARSVCLRQTSRTAIRTCPPLDLRTGERASLECRCSDERSVLNCLGGVGPARTQGGDGHP